MSTPKRHILARNRVFWRSLREGQCGEIYCKLYVFFQLPREMLKNGRQKTRLWARGRTPKNEIIAEPEELYFTHMERKNPDPIWTKFCTEGDIWDLVTLANFGVDRFRGFSVARSQIFRLFRRLSPSSITLSHYRASVWSYNVQSVFKYFTW